MKNDTHTKKSLEEMQVAIDEISAVCEKHGIVLLGVGDGIYTEIALVEVGREDSWVNPSQRAYNEIFGDKSALYPDQPITYYVQAIGCFTEKKPT
jgi:hypothetical protein